MKIYEVYARKIDDAPLFIQEFFKFKKDAEDFYDIIVQNFKLIREETKNGIKEIYVHDQFERMQSESNLR